MRESGGDGMGVTPQASPPFVFRALALAALALALCLGGCSRDQANEADPPRLAKADADFASGLYLAAEEGYEEFLQATPMHPRRFHALSRLVQTELTVKGDPERAAAMLEAMLLEFDGEPDRARWILRSLGDIAQSLGQVPRAVDAWRKALAIPGGLPLERCTTALRLGRGQSALGQVQPAAASFRTCAADASPPLPDGENAIASCRVQCILEEAQLQVRVEAYAAARSILEQALADPASGLPPEERAELSFALAEVLVLQGEPRKAREALLGILSTHPNPKVVEARLKSIPAP